MGKRLLTLALLLPLLAACGSSGGETAAGPPAQRREASFEEAIQRIAVAAPDTIQQVDGGLERFRSTW